VVQVVVEPFGVGCLFLGLSTKQIRSSPASPPHQNNPSGATLINIMAKSGLHGGHHYGKMGFWEGKTIAGSLIANHRAHLEAGQDDVQIEIK